MINKSNLFLNEEDGVKRNVNELYSVCLPELSEETIFYPRIPKNRADDEDSCIPRICLSSSLSGCISAVPWGGKDFETMIPLVYSYKENESCVIKVSVFDINDIDKNNILTPEYLYQKDYVRDAKINSEYWVINQNLKPIREHYIQVLNYFEEVVDSISYENMLLINSDGDGKLDFEDYIDGCFTKISVYEYKDICIDDIVIDDAIEIPNEFILENKDLEDIKDDIISITNDFLVLGNSVIDVINDGIKITIYLDYKATIIIKDLIESIREVPCS